jgi:Na+/melibiose symporter-like transporter
VSLIAAGSVWPLIVSAVAVDRAAKGLRTAPRDALISLSATPANLAASFGVHRALDGGGAMLGPLAALALLTALPNAFDVVFMASFSIGVAGVGVLLIFVQNRRGGSDDARRRTFGREALRALGAARGFRALTLSAFLLSLVTISDGFLYLALQQRAGLRPALVPLLFVGTAAGYLLAAIPAGWLADRFGRRTIFVLGYGALALAYAAVLAPRDTVAAVLVCIASLGIYYAMTDGVLMALASSMLPADVRGTGLACVTTVASGGRFASSLAFGALWTAYGLTAPLASFLAALGAAGVVAALLLMWSARASEQAIDAE